MNSAGLRICSGVLRHVFRRVLYLTRTLHYWETSWSASTFSPPHALQQRGRGSGLRHSGGPQLAAHLREHPRGRCHAGTTAGGSTLALWARHPCAGSRSDYVVSGGRPTRIARTLLWSNTLVRFCLRGLLCGSLSIRFVSVAISTLAHREMSGGRAGDIQQESSRGVPEKRIRSRVLRARRIQCFAQRKPVYRRKELGHGVGPVRIDYWIDMLHKPRGWVMDFSDGPEKGQSLSGDKRAPRSRRRLLQVRADMCGCQVSACPPGFFFCCGRLSAWRSRVCWVCWDTPNHEFSGLQLLVCWFLVVGSNESLRAAGGCEFGGLQQLSCDAREGIDTPGRREPEESRMKEPKRWGLSLHERTGSVKNSAVSATAGVMPFGLGGNDLPLT